MSEQKLIIFNFLNHYLPIFTLIAFIFLILFFITFFVYKNKKPFCIRFIEKNILPLAFFSTLFATVVSLIYSDYLGEAPCGLCWFQRIFIYSQVLLYAVAYIKDDIKVFSYTLWLSIVGGIIALYHSYLQLGFNEAVPCPVTPGFIDCAKPTFVSFGFITFPFMSFVLFMFLILLSVILMRKEKRD